MREGLHEDEDREGGARARMKPVLVWSFVDVVAAGLVLLLTLSSLWRR